MSDDTPRSISVMADTLVGSEILQLAATIRQKQQAGAKIYNLTIGDFDPHLFPIPHALQDAIVAAYDTHETNYPAANGMPELRAAVSHFLQAKGNLSYSPDEIVIAAGARPLIYSVFTTLLDPVDDYVLFPLPSWNNNHYTHLARANSITVKTRPENDFLPTADDLKPHLSKVTLLALCSPLNPTGTVFTPSNLAAICELVWQENKVRKQQRKKPLYILFDQIYWTLTHGRTKHVDPVSLDGRLKPYCLYIDGLSKAFCATGVRVGWCCGPPPIVRKLTTILGHIGAWAPRAEQVGCSVFLRQLEGIQIYQTHLKGELVKRLDAFYNGMMELKAQGHSVDAIAPQAAIYLTVQFDLVGKETKRLQETTTTLTNAAHVADFLLQEAGLAIVPFSAFGAPQESPWYRLSVGTCVFEEIVEIFAKLSAALNQLT